MSNQRRLINKGLIMAKFECEINKLLNIISKQDKKVESLEYRLNIAEKNRKDLAGAYARKLGIIQTKKEFERTIKGLGRFRETNQKGVELK